jgi:hypothetical protein
MTKVGWSKYWLTVQAHLQVHKPIGDSTELLSAAEQHRLLLVFLARHRQLYGVSVQK